MFSSRKSHSKFPTTRTGGVEWVWASRNVKKRWAHTHIYPWRGVWVVFSTYSLNTFSSNLESHPKWAARYLRLGWGGVLHC